ncbi:MAG: hypothetical protein IJX85_04395 [Lachnospiraceae bacterium]|nr:hypothetical protein [Lachnospiraceae bacterium]
MRSNSKVNLLQMQGYFEGQMDKIRVISDLKLSENEYRSLGVKLKSLSFFVGSENDIEDYMLSILVYSTYSLIYGAVDTDFEDIFWSVIPENQYMKRMYLRMYKDVFYTYGISTYDVPRIDFLPRCKYLTARHAGIPDCDKSEYYRILSNSSSDEGHIYEEIRDKLPTRTRNILDMMDEVSRYKLLKDSKQLVQDVLDIDSLPTHSALIDKYPELDLNLIVDCIMWGFDKDIKNENSLKQAF